MSKFLIGRKVGMTQIFDENGKVVPVTVIEAGPNVVVQKKSVETDGYTAVQLGFGDIRPKLVNKPQAGHFKKNDLPNKRVLKEFRLRGGKDGGEASEGSALEVFNSLNIGDTLKAETFAEGDVVDISGTSKGKGFQGAVKRHGQRTLRESHGTGPVARHAGSMGACSSPSRIFKGKKMPGHMGTDKVTVQNLTIVKVDAENGLVAVRGAIPGPNKGIVTIRSAVKGAGKAGTGKGAGAGSGKDKAVAQGVK